MNYDNLMTKWMLLSLIRKYFKYRKKNQTYLRGELYRKCGVVYDKY